MRRTSDTDKCFLLRVAKKPGTDGLEKSFTKDTI